MKLEDYQKILGDLIQFPSINDGEEAVACYIKELFDQHQIESTIYPVEAGRANIVAKIKGSKPGKIFAISGHLDVVATGDVSSWKHDPFAGEIEDGRMYGRGTADMKAGVAAGAIALIELKESQIDFPGEVWFIGTVGEEIGMIGAKALVDEGILDDVDAVIIPEPTNGNQAIYANKGSIQFQVTAKGKAAHSSAPHLGVNAIMTACKYILRVQERFDEISQDPKYHNSEMGNTLNVFSTIEGGSQINSVPDLAVFQGNVRSVPEFGTKEVCELFESVIEEMNQDPSNAELSIHYHQILDAAQSAKDSDLIKALLVSAKDKKIEVLTTAGATELSRYRQISDDIQMVVYGPGLTENAHIVDEWIDLEEYYDCIEILKETAIHFLTK